jgi:hypothetical protein
LCCSRFAPISYVSPQKSSNIHAIYHEDGRTFVAYDNFVSLLVQYKREEVTRVAQIVEQKLEMLVAEVTTESVADA